MVHNDEAKLVTLTASGSTVVRTETPVWCTKKSVSYKEFYAAVEVGINPTYIFEVDIEEYIRAIITETGGTKKRPTELIFDGEKFNIIRTYEKVGGLMEITVSL
ncbi:MAG: hypothetical protein J6U23_05170 [Clostridiales bacterium]|nr:hypothetical protein [Clostridiales bacterium]